MKLLSLFLWVELIGFDNTRPDFGVTDYPSLPMATVLRGKIAPHDTIFFSVGEHEVAFPGEEAK